MIFSVVEKYSQKNHNRNWLRFFWPAWYAVAKQLQIFVFCFAIAIFKNHGAINIPLERYFENLSNGMFHAPRYLEFQLLNQRIKYVVV